MFCEYKEDVEKLAHVLNDWFRTKGLTLSEEKTRIVHLKDGFEFFGFNIRHYAVDNTTTDWKLLIKPSKKSIQKIRDKIRQL